MSGMDELVTWLRAQLDEDERVARAAGGSEWTVTEATERDDPWLDGVGVFARSSQAPGFIDPPDADHIARHDPARVLAEVAAKRRILDTLTSRERADDSEEGLWHKIGYDRAAFDVIRLLALPYADRPGFRDEWRVQ